MKPGMKKNVGSGLKHCHSWIELCGKVLAPGVLIRPLYYEQSQLEDEDVLKEQVLETVEITGEGSVISKEEALKQIGISLRCWFRVLLRRRMLEDTDNIWPEDA